MINLQTLTQRVHHAFWLPRAQHTIEHILHRREAPQPYDDETIFWRLQRSYPPRLRYRYDTASRWQRAVERAQLLTRHLPAPGRVLEVGCGDGLTGYALHCCGYDCTLADVDDWRDERARSLQFLRADVCVGLDLAAEQFDLIYSYNTLEHVANPAAAFAELLRLCRPGGFIALKWGPLYASAWGLHAYKTMPIPYAQFLFSAPFIEHKLRLLGIDDLGTVRDALQPLNRWRAAQFRALWQRSDLTVLAYDATHEYDHLGLVTRFPAAFTGQTLTFEDLTVKNLRLLLQKTGAHDARS